MGLDCYALICKLFVMMDTLIAANESVRRAQLLQMNHAYLNKGKHPSGMMGEHTLMRVPKPRNQENIRS